MNPLLAFLLGFLAAGTLSTCLVYAYYRRAKKRVQSIKDAICRYQQASATVNQAIANTKFPSPNA